jgi:hypothetical protein
MANISRAELERIVEDILADREIIIRHNPIGTEEEILLWMLLSVLTSYLSLSEMETPCFPGKPDAAAWRNAIRFVLRGRLEDGYDPEPILNRIP